MTITPALDGRRIFFPAVANSRRPRNLFLFATGFIFSTGSVVLREPAPIDLGLMLLLGFGLLAGKLKLGPVPSVPVFLLVVFSCANLVSMTSAVDAGRAVWYFAVTFYLILTWAFLVGIFNRYGSKAAYAVFAGYTIAGLVSAVLGTAAYLHLIPFSAELLLNGRPKGLFKDPNVFGPYLVPIALFSLAFCTQQAKLGLRFLLCASMLILSTIAVLLSFSRACWINMATCFVCFFPLQAILRGFDAWSVRRLAAGASCLGVLAVGVALISQTSQVHQMMEVRVSSNGLQNYDVDRFDTHRRALEAAEAHLTGIGPGQSEQVFQYAAHSLYIRVLAENGLLGLVTFLCFLVLCFTRSLWLARAAANQTWRWIATANAACLLGLFVNSGVIDTLHWRHVWVLFAIPWIRHPDVFRPGSSN